MRRLVPNHLGRTSMRIFHRNGLDPERERAILPRGKPLEKSDSMSFVEMDGRMASCLEARREG
jgi:hypothetical protein